MGNWGGDIAAPLFLQWNGGGGVRVTGYKVGLDSHNGGVYGGRGVFPRNDGRIGATGMPPLYFL